MKRLRDTASSTFLEITITEGRNRQVRRMIEAVGSRRAQVSTHVDRAGVDRKSRDWEISRSVKGGTEGTRSREFECSAVR